MIFVAFDATMDTETWTDFVEQRHPLMESP